MKPASPYLTAKEAALYLRLERPDGSPDMNRFYCLRSRMKRAGHPLRARRLGGLMRFKQADLDSALEQERPGPTRLQNASGF